VDHIPRGRQVEGEGATPGCEVQGSVTSAATVIQSFLNDPNVFSDGSDGPSQQSHESQLFKRPFRRAGREQWQGLSPS
jgi:hypothetical protein